MRIKTKSGFVIDVEKERATDWRTCKCLRKIDSGDGSLVLQGITDVVPFLLGEDGEAALMKHVENEKGIIPTEKIIGEIKEIIEKLGEEAKKSGSSQE